MEQDADSSRLREPGPEPETGEEEKGRESGSGKTGIVGGRVESRS